MYIAGDIETTRKILGDLEKGSNSRLAAHTCCCGSAESPYDGCEIGPVMALLPWDAASGSLTPGPGVPVFSSVTKGPTSVSPKSDIGIYLQLEPLASTLPLMSFTL